MNKRFILIAGLLVVGILAFFLVKNKKYTQVPSTANTKLQISTSFYPLYFFASQIAMDKAEVKNITPAGSEPHDYEPTAQDIARIEKSNLLILNGGVEAWGDKIKDNLKGTNVKIITAGNGLLTQQITEEGKAQTDPHVWLDPLLANFEVYAIENGYKDIDPINAAYYSDTAGKLVDRLFQLDKEYRKGLQNCKSHDIVTSHAAFGYLAKEYGLKQIPIAGLSPDAEPSQKQLVDISDFARKNNVKYIFFESLVSPKLSETIASEVGAKTLVLDPLEGLSDDDIKGGKDYFTVMQDNLKNLQTALSCKTT